MFDVDGGVVALLVTALVLGFRHGIDWDHLAAITDITSTSGAAEAAEGEHQDEHSRAEPPPPVHGGSAEMAAHDASPEDQVPHDPVNPGTRPPWWQLERQPVIL